MCTGTVAGEFDPSVHQFVNQTFSDVKAALKKTFTMMRRANRDIRFLLTVSPVPLTATKSDRHVVVATMASKSILRAVADQMATERDDVDYFPSYEIINSPVFRGSFFATNQRTVRPDGVEFVMTHFFNGLIQKNGADVMPDVTQKAGVPVDEVCEEELLETFGKETD